MIESRNSQTKRSFARFLIVLVLLFLATVPLFAQSAGFPLGWSELLPVHIVAMALSAGSMLTGMFIARYRKRKSKNWLRQHKFFQGGAAILGAIGIATSVTMVQVTYDTHFNVAHSFIAAISFAMILLAIIVAYSFLKGKKHKKELRTMHRWIGRGAISAWLVTIVFGLFAAGIL